MKSKQRQTAEVTKPSLSQRERVGLCPLCGGATLQLFIWGDSPRVERCRACGTAAIKPPPQPWELREYYQDNLTSKTPDKDLPYLIELWSEALKLFMNKMERTGNTPFRFLDMGFGNGASLFAASKLGLLSYGVDLDPTNVAHAQAFTEKNRIRVICEYGDIQSTKGWSVQFDIIKASQVLEHMVDPIDFLSEAASLQPVGGYLIVDCPNNSAAFWLVKNRFRKQWGRMSYYDALKLEEHLWGFTRKGLLLLLQKIGYEVIFCQDYPMGAIFQPETRLWYPTLREGFRRSIKLKRPYDVGKACIRIFDTVASMAFRRGMGLVALGRKRAPS